MIGRFLKGLPIAAVALALAANAAWAGKANDTLVWTTDREATAADPYYDNIRELVIIGHTVWDGLLFRNLDTGEYEPLLATGYEWIDNTTIDNNQISGSADTAVHIDTDDGDVTNTTITKGDFDLNLEVAFVRIREA